MTTLRGLEAQLEAANPLDCRGHRCSGENLFWGEFVLGRIWLVCGLLPPLFVVGESFDRPCVVPVDFGLEFISFSRGPVRICFE